MSEDNWPFADAPNVASIVDGRIFRNSTWIYYVSHDADDGMWQFHGPGFASDDDAKVIALRTVLEIDPSVEELADLPLGWFAWREAAHFPWRREMNESS